MTVYEGLIALLILGYIMPVAYLTRYRQEYNNKHNGRSFLLTFTPMVNAIVALVALWVKSDR